MTVLKNTNINVMNVYLIRLHFTNFMPIKYDNIKTQNSYHINKMGRFRNTELNEQVEPDELL